MIAKLFGVIDTVGADWLILNVHGVGYLVQASGRTLNGLPAVGSDASLAIETVVREDAITLFGFATGDEQDMFRLLTSVQGVGAKVALAILSVLGPADLRNAIAAQDKGSISRANGVGPKLAARIANELKDKVAGFVAAPKGVQLDGQAAPTATAAEDSVIADVVSALANLGYGAGDAHGAAVRARAELGEDAKLEAIIPQALKELAGG